MGMKQYIVGGGIGLILGIAIALFFGIISVEEFPDPEGEVRDYDTPVAIRTLVEDHARAWETGDEALLLSTIHEDIVFAYPGRRLNYDELIEDFQYYRENFEDTKVYLHDIIVEGNMVAVEWQFAATEKESGKRTAVSDGIIGEIKDGKIVSWKEYLDGRVSRMQKVDALPLEEGEEPFPAPVGSLRNFCEATQKN
jgi:ketosteroid isomerase-like protein